jgi:hypothetical protein
MSGTTTSSVTAGISFGSALAMTISWSLYHSILWACVHAAFSLRDLFLVDPVLIE